MNRLVLQCGTDPSCTDRLALVGLWRVRLLSVVFSATAEGINPGSPVARSIRPLPAHVVRTVPLGKVTHPMGGFERQRWGHQRHSHPLHDGRPAWRLAASQTGLSLSTPAFGVVVHRYRVERRGCVADQDDRYNPRNVSPFVWGNSLLFCIILRLHFLSDEPSSS